MSMLMLMRESEGVQEVYTVPGILSSYINMMKMSQNIYEYDQGDNDMIMMIR